MLSVAGQLKSKIDELFERRQSYLDGVTEMDHQISKMLSVFNSGRKANGKRATKRGRPEPENQSQASPKKKIGRPKGSKNKPKVPQPETVSVSVEKEQPQDPLPTKRAKPFRTKTVDA